MSNTKFRFVCDAMVGTSFSSEDFPVSLDFDRHLLYASPHETTSEGFLLNISTLATTIHLSTHNLYINRKSWLLYGLGYFFGEHSYVMKTAAAASYLETFRISEKDEGLSAKVGVAVTILPKIDLQMTLHLMSSLKKVEPYLQKYKIVTLPTPAISMRWLF